MTCYKSGLGGIGMGLGPGGQPINATHVGVPSGMGNMGPGGMGGSPGFGGMNRMGGGIVGFGGMEGMNNMGGFGGVHRMTGGGVGAVGIDRMGSNFDRIGTGLDMDRGFGGFGSNQLGSGKRDRIGTKGCQIFVRNLPFDLTWQKLKEKFSQCGPVMFAEIKMENGKSKGCGTVRFDSPETADKACRLMNGMKISGRELDVRMDRNA